MVIVNTPAYTKRQLCVSLEGVGEEDAVFNIDVFPLFGEGFETH